MADTEVSATINVFARGCEFVFSRLNPATITLDIGQDGASSVVLFLSDDDVTRLTIDALTFLDRASEAQAEAA